MDNMVFVRKGLNKWCMCVDFTDLSVACPKYLYPLPNMDILIYGFAGYKKC